MWKYLAESVAGTGHARTGHPCQDHCLATLVPDVPGPVLLLACADGAGSAQHGEAGARLACETIAQAVAAELSAGRSVATIERDSALAWVRQARHELEQEALRREVRPRDLASTLLLAVVGEQAAGFVQVGDGAIVLREGEDYRPVFWPEAGEYANCTHFLTDDDLDNRLSFARIDQRLDELALFSDGLQRLALDHRTRTGYAPFLAPLFRPLREVADPATLAGPLRQFLDSARINQRTDDDKTLLLATRVAV